MKKIHGLILAAGIIATAETGCKKHTDAPPASGPTLADTLRAECTAPFEGNGDTSHIYLPTAFSPNGDGLNDIYGLIGHSVAPGYFSSVSMKIYDTTGVLVYENTGNALPAWDGVDRNTHAKSTKYKFYVQVKYTTTGNVTDSGNTYLYLLSGSSCVNTVAADVAHYRFPTQYDLKTGYNAAWSSFETYCP